MSETAQTPSRSAFPTAVAILGSLLIFYFFISFTYLDSEVESGEPSLERPSLAEHEAKASDKLSNYSVMDVSAGKVRLPIERAKELIVSENSK